MTSNNNQQLTIPWLPRFQAWPVKLYVYIPVVYAGERNREVLSATQSAAHSMVNFYAQSRVRIIPRIWGVDGSVYNVEDALTLHMHQGLGNPLTILSLADLTIWRGAYGGEAITSSLAVVVSGRFLSSYLVHELGHLLLSQPPSRTDHDPETFMIEAPSQTFDKPMTTNQKTRIYERAWELGGY